MSPLDTLPMFDPPEKQPGNKLTYIKQPAIAASKGNVPLAGTSHVYRVAGLLWQEQVESLIATLLLPKSLHVCCGKSQLGDVRCDIDPANKPDVIADAASLPFDDVSFESVLCDPPYNGKMQWQHDLLSELSRVARRRIIFQHWFLPVDVEGRWKKWHLFRLTALYMWQPRTYFGRAQVISVCDALVPGEPAAPVPFGGISNQSWGRQNGSPK